MTMHIGHYICLRDTARIRFWSILACRLLLWAVAAPAGAVFPWSRTGSAPSDPYNYYRGPQEVRTLEDILR